MFPLWLCAGSVLTDHVKVGVLDEGRVGGDLALVQPNVALLRELDLKLPVVRLLVDNLEPAVKKVSLSTIQILRNGLTLAIGLD